MNNQSDNVAAPSRTTVRIPTASGDELQAWLYLPEGNGPHPAVVMAHGIGAIKAGGLAGAISSHLYGGLWNVLAMFASPLFAELIDHPARPDLILPSFAWLGNLAVIVGCVWSYLKLTTRRRRDIARLMLTLWRQRLSWSRQPRSLHPTISPLSHGRATHIGPGPALDAPACRSVFR
jgi:hypothetical protein